MKFNLREIRRKMFEGFKKKWSLYNGNDFEKIDVIEKEVDEQDKEFIKRIEKIETCASQEIFIQIVKELSGETK